MEKIELKDFLNYNCIAALELSPNGKTAGFVVHKADLDTDGYHSNLWVMEMETGACRQLTSGNNEKGLLWLNDFTVLFPSLRGSTLKKEIAEGEDWTVYYAIGTDGGEAVEYMRVPLKVTAIQMLDPDHFVLSATCRNQGVNLHDIPKEQRAEAVGRLKKEKDYEVVDEIPFVGNGRGFVNKLRNRLYLFDRKTGGITPVSDAMRNVESFRCSGGKILYIAKNYTDMLTRPDGLYEYDLASGETNTLLEDGVYHLVLACYLGGKVVVKMTDMKPYGLYQNTDFYTLEPDGPKLLCRDDFGYMSTVGSDCRYGASRVAKQDGDTLYYISTQGISSMLNALTPDGKLVTITEDTGSVDTFDVSGGRVAFVGMRGQRLQELYGLEQGIEKRLTSFNEAFCTDKSISLPRHFVYRNDGVELDGFVMEPVGFEDGGSYPAVLDIHGGPKTVFGHLFYHEMQVWANMGYFVLYCNPRGGDGKGSEFADLRGKYGTVDYEDIMKFVDVALEKYPQIDQDRLGVTGGSYGGFMTNWIIGHTDRFKCAASQRCISNWFTEFGTTDIGYYFTVDQNAATPWSDPEKLWWHSPLKYADNVKTPTLFIHSDQDYRCWLPEGFQMFTALKYHGVPARMVMFRGENHELSRGGKPSHRIRRLEEITDWLEKYLKPAAKSKGGGHV